MMHVITTYLWLLSLLFSTHLYSQDSNHAPHATHIIAHRASSGLWIQNSAHAVKNTVALFTREESRFHGIEVDIVLTKDHVPVLSHEPWVHTTLCKKVNQQPLTHTLIRDIIWHDLHNNFRCGGIKDTHFPLAATHAEPIMGFDEFLIAIKNTPTLIVYLDIKIQADLTATAQDYAAAIFSRWQRAGMTNPLYIETPTKESLTIFQQYTNINFTSVLSYPPFYTGENWWIKGAKTAVMSFIFPSRAAHTALLANAHALATPIEVLNTRMRKKLQSEQKQVVVFTPNDAATFTTACEAQVDMIITDYPTLGDCRVSLHAH
jgi:glycerophosphoryl diester phosphodiesterase